MPATKFAVFAFFGLPNAGKSTLLNALVGEKLAPVHRKPQMTRKNLMGIVTHHECQFVFIDTPGFQDGAQTLNVELRGQLFNAMKDCDAVIALCDTMSPLTDEMRHGIETVSKKNEVLLVLNKTDLPRASWKLTPEILRKYFPALRIQMLSAFTGEGLSEFKEALSAMAPLGPWHFAEDEMTTASTREIAAGCLLEKAMEYLEQEIPYQIAVVIEDYKETPERDHISAVIIVNRDSQKGMVIGRGGATLKKIGGAARKELEAFLGRKVFLEVFVKVDKNWARNPSKIREYYGFTRR